MQNQDPSIVEISKINYQLCENQGLHNGEELNRVCLDTKCRKNNDILSCNICIQEKHKGHTNKSLKSLLNNIYIQLYGTKEQQEKIKQQQQNGNDKQQQQQQKSDDDQNNINEQEIKLQEINNLIEQSKQILISEYQNEANKWNQKIQEIGQIYEKIFKELKLRVQMKFGNYSENNNQQDNAQNEYKNQLKQMFEDVSDNKFGIELKLLNNNLQQLITYDPCQQQQQGEDKNQILPLNKLSEQIIKTQQQFSKQIQDNSQTLIQKFELQTSQIKNFLDQKIYSDKIFYQSQINYLFKKNKNSSSLICHEEGIEFQNNSTCGVEQVIYSDATFDSGQHGYTLQLKEFEQSSSWCFLIGVYEESKSQSGCTTSGHPWSCLFNNCRGYMSPDNQHFGQILKNGDSLHIELDYEKNTYTVKDSQNKLTYFLKEGAWSFQGKKLKFFISFLSPELNVRIRILESY